MNIGVRITELRESKNMTQKELADKIRINKSVMNRIESGERPIRETELSLIADALEVSTDYLLGRVEPQRKYYDLTDKDEKDISERLQTMIKDLENKALFSKEDGEMDDNTRELLIMSLENSLRIAKQEAKKKFTPKKYRD
ncbi:DNA-binding protein [Carnobacterium divergens]|nr:helix-turn-helix transcriptional regulator [Carnobacterium divergens]MCO6018279.1 helix-turn-helix domain-containing protein [Carnobacterium divergens]TFI64858.1 DNA-binding protein [Carnobacterium divergens]TFI91732.1 DNA-binding protein [Carnobacterium divergens]TFJ07063.1 DNA-binding protein [Carnobacterium divergens]TFJ08288.1 DNA-binding protein [Carnobacterium divergens]